MRGLFILSFAANLLLTMAALGILPGRVAINFGAGGEPNGWAPAYVNALLMGGVHLSLFLSIFLSPQLLRWTPA